MSVQGAVDDLMGDHDGARQFYSAALKIAPGEANILNNLGLSYALTKDLKQAEATLREASGQPARRRAGAQQSRADPLARRQARAGREAQQRGYPARSRASQSAVAQAGRRQTRRIVTFEQPRNSRTSDPAMTIQSQAPWSPQVSWSPPASPCCRDGPNIGTRSPRPACSPPAPSPRSAPAPRFSSWSCNGARPAFATRSSNGAPRSLRCRPPRRARTPSEALERVATLNIEAASSIARTCRLPSRFSRGNCPASRPTTSSRPGALSGRPVALWSYGSISRAARSPSKFAQSLIDAHVIVVNNIGQLDANAHRRASACRSTAPIRSGRFDLSAGSTPSAIWTPPSSTRRGQGRRRRSGSRSSSVSSRWRASPTSHNPQCDRAIFRRSVPPVAALRRAA